MVIHMALTADLPPEAGKLPLLSEALVSKLEELFPERCPDPSWDDRRIWREVGKVEIVRFLRAELEQQIQSSLETSINVHV